MLEVRKISKKFGGIKALNEVSFDLNPGEVVGYLGPNGSGKSTTMKILTGLLKPSTGEIYYRNESIKKDLYSYKSKIGYSPENANLYRYMSGYDYLLLIGRLRKIKEKELNRKIEILTEIFEIDNSIFNSISTYSKGMEQKIVIISTIIHNPDILYFDEPLSGLDIKTVSIFKEMITKMSVEGKIILYSSHLVEIVEKLCNRLIILNKGRIVKDEYIKILKKSSGSEFISDILREELDPEKISKNAEIIMNTIMEQ